MASDGVKVGERRHPLDIHTDITTSCQSDDRQIARVRGVEPKIVGSGRRRQIRLAVRAVNERNRGRLLTEVPADQGAQHRPADDEPIPIAVEVKPLRARPLVVGQPSLDLTDVGVGPISLDVPDAHVAIAKGW